MKTGKETRIRLSEAQLVVLSTAAQRDDGAVLPLRETLVLPAAARAKVLGALERRGLITSIPDEGSDDSMGNGRAITITAQGLAAIGIERDQETDAPTSQHGSPVQSPDDPAQTEPRERRTTSGPARRRRASETKAQSVLALLTRPEGASLAEIQAATGWQAHSVRGFLSGTVKTKMGLALSSQRDGDGIRRYRIVSGDRDATVERKPSRGRRAGAVA